MSFFMWEFWAIFLGVLGLTYAWLSTAWKLKQAYKDNSFGCYTRQKLEDLYQGVEKRKGKALIFLDINNVHNLNGQLGYAYVDQLIASSLRLIRCPAYRCFSGDEIVIPCSTDEAFAILERVEEAFTHNGLSFEYAVIEFTGRSLKEAIAMGGKVVQSKKSRRVRI